MPALRSQNHRAALGLGAEPVWRIGRDDNRFSGMGDARRLLASRQGAGRRRAHHSDARAYIVSYRAEIADALTSELTVIDGGLTFLTATNVTEATRQGERRKYLRIEVIRG